MLSIDPFYHFVMGGFAFGMVFMATDPVSGATNFTKAAKGTFSKSDLTALCPVSSWDAVFASQVDSVITNPPSDPVPDESFAVPS